MNRLGAVVVMGVAGVGKTSVGRALAERLGWRFEDADDYHPAANKAKMRAGIPLDDADRWPWLERLRALLVGAIEAGDGVVLACSALRQAYRDRLGDGDPRLAFVFLDGDRRVIESRLQARSGHYMPPSLLDSQLATLEVPEHGLRVDVDAELGAIADAALAALVRLDRERAALAPPTP